MGLVLITPPTEFPVTLAEAKLHARVASGAAEDTLIQGYIAAATSYVEQHLGQSVSEQTWRLDLDEFPDEIELPLGPVLGVVSVEYYSDATTVATILDTDYQVDLSSYPSRIVPVSGWPTPYDRVNPISVTFTTGFDEVPAAVKQAILILVSDFYHFRENVAPGQTIPELPFAVKSLLSLYRKVFV